MATQLLFGILFCLLQSGRVESKLAAWSYDKHLIEGRWRQQIGISPNGVVYLFGGDRLSPELSNQIWKWNTTNHVFQWDVLSVTTPTSAFISYNQNSVSVGNYVYFMGINDGTANYGTGVSYVFDMANEVWITGTVNIPTMPVPTIWGCLATDEDLIYYIGGSNGANAYVEVMQIYDISANKWTVSPLPFGESSHAMCSIDRQNQYLYLFGGYINVNAVPQRISTIYVYNIGLNAWNPISIGDLTAARNHGRAILGPDDNIYIIGGSMGGISSNLVDVFDPITYTVSSGPNLFKGVFAAPMAVVCDRVHIFGGAYFNGTNNYDISSYLLDIQISNTLDYSASYDYTEPQTMQWWIYDTHLIEGRWRHQLGISPYGVVYVFGGDRVSPEFSNQIWKWNTTNHVFQWEVLSVTTPTSRFTSYNQNSVSIGNYVYFMGINDGTATYGTGVSYVFDMANEVWITGTVNIPTMPVPTIWGCLATDDDYIYYIGGSNGANTYVEIMQTYDISANQWTVSQLPFGESSHAMCSVDRQKQYLYLFGGYINVNAVPQRISTIYVYNIGLNAWNPISIGDLTAARNDGRAILGPDDNIYIIGGYNGSVSFDLVDVFNPITYTVSNGPHLFKGVFAAPMAVVCDRVHIFGGAYWNGTNNNEISS
eukprot:161851_1